MQRDLIETLDDTRDPDAVIGRLAERLRRLAAGDVPADDLLVCRRVRQAADDYRGQTRTVAALRRARRRGHPIHPGQDVRFLVVDDDGDTADRVRLGTEVTPETRYDTGFYRESALRAAASVPSPFGWSVEAVRSAVANGSDDSLLRF